MIRNNMRVEDTIRSPQNILLALYFFSLTLVTAFYERTLLHKPTVWSVEDWLLNYQGGFVRRGITGEFAFRMGALLHTGPQMVVCTLQFCLYLVLFLSAYHLLQYRKEHSPWTWALVLSPATFGFHIVDQVGGFRKEILLFAGLGILLVLLKKGVNDNLVTALLCLWIPLAILAHESIFFYTGYYGVALLLSARKRFGVIPLRYVGIRLLLPLAVSLVAMLAVSFHPGNPKIAAAVCTSLHDKGILECGPAITYLGNSLEQARDNVLLYRRKFDFPTLYGITGILTLFPIGVLLICAWKQQPTRTEAVLLCSFALFIFVISLPLYLYALDWGRWIYMHAMCLTLLLLFLDWDHAKSAMPARYALQAGGLKRVCTSVALLAYATTWTLPHLPEYTLYFGYVQRVSHSQFMHVFVATRNRN